MTELLFYHLERQPLAAVLPRLLEMSLERGWRVVVQTSSEERVEALDAHLWTYREDSFLPHGTYRDREASEQPIVLALGEENPNGASVRFLIDGVDLPTDAGDYARIVLLFDGGEPDELAAARMRWQAAKARDLEVTYWQQNTQGRWERKGLAG